MKSIYCVRNSCVASAALRRCHAEKRTKILKGILANANSNTFCPLITHAFAHRIICINMKAQTGNSSTVVLSEQSTTLRITRTNSRRPFLPLLFTNFEVPRLARAIIF